MISGPCTYYADNKHQRDILNPGTKLARSCAASSIFWAAAQISTLKAYADTGQNKPPTGPKDSYKVRAIDNIIY